MSGTVYNITPSSGANFYQTYPLQPPIGGTGPQYPLPAMQLGMQPGKILQGSNAVNWILGQTAAAALAANAATFLNPATFVVAGTGIACSPAVAVPAQSLAWFYLTAPLPFAGMTDAEETPPPPDEEIHQPSRGRGRS